MKVKTSLIFIFIITIVTMSIGYDSAEGIVSITLKEHSNISGERIFLNKIANIDGDKKEIKEFGPIYIGRLPLQEMTRIINKDYIKLRIKQTKADISKVVLIGPEKIKVTRASREISEEEIREIVEAFLLRRIQRRRENVELKISYNGKILVPSHKEISYEVIPFKALNQNNIYLLDVIFKADSRIVEKIRVTSKIDRRIPVFFTSRPIDRHQIISENDVFMEERRISDLPQKVIWELEDVIGKRARRNIPANTILRKNLLEHSSLIKKGDLVTILAESKTLKITTKGEAREKGSKGDVIKVRNLSSKKIIGGLVLDKSTVKIEF